MNLQPRWDLDSIPNLIWSGIEATGHLIVSMLRLCNTETMATISHGNASFKSLSKSLEEGLENIQKSWLSFIPMNKITELNNFMRGSISFLGGLCDI